ncbi:MAG: alkaline phosphatase family protein [Actinomycetota bacterium]|nr:alkaline phosphatase family protein [Actinomycetota bacterium]
MTRRVPTVVVALSIATAACTSTIQSPEGGPGEEAVKSCDRLDRLVTRTRRGFVPGRSADILVVPREPSYIGTAQRPVHTGPWDYLAEVPLVFYGPGVVPPLGSVDRPATMADVAATLGEMIGYEFDAPDGRVLREPSRLENEPRVVVVIVWDGGGWNALHEHAESWPFLKKMTRDGVSFSDATIGSSPSNTPPIHTTLGTGAFPSTHGIANVRIRTSSGGYTDPFEENDGRRIEVPSLADRFDRALGNRPVVGVVGTVNWHLGMIGHGASFPEGDRDLAVLLDVNGNRFGNGDVYDIPEGSDARRLAAFAAELDRSDGVLDDKWRAVDVTDPAIRYASPAYVSYEGNVVERVVRSRRFGDDPTPDLLFVNFKTIDSAGHRWGMTSPEVGEVIASADRALRKIATVLEEVAPQSWALVVTADHGQTPYPSESGGWPIKGAEVKADIESEFGGGYVERVTSGGIFMTPDGVDRAEEIGAWLGSYEVEDNLGEGQTAPARWEGRLTERLFDVVMVGEEVVYRAC